MSERVVLTTFAFARFAIRSSRVCDWTVEAAAVCIRLAPQPILSRADVLVQREGGLWVVVDDSLCFAKSCHQPVAAGAVGLWHRVEGDL